MNDRQIAMFSLCFGWIFGVFISNESNKVDYSKPLKVYSVSGTDSGCSYKIKQDINSIFKGFETTLIKYPCGKFKVGDNIEMIKITK